MLPVDKTRIKQINKYNLRLLQNSLQCSITFYNLNLIGIHLGYDPSNIIVYQINTTDIPEVGTSVAIHKFYFLKTPKYPKGSRKRKSICKGTNKEQTSLVKVLKKTDVHCTGNPTLILKECSKTIVQSYSHHIYFNG